MAWYCQPRAARAVTDDRLAVMVSRSPLAFTSALTLRHHLHQNYFAAAARLSPASPAVIPVVFPVQPDPRPTIVARHRVERRTSDTKSRSKFACGF
jgi:hypothetical protein